MYMAGLGRPDLLCRAQRVALLLFNLVKAYGDAHIQEAWRNVLHIVLWFRKLVPFTSSIAISYLCDPAFVWLGPVAGKPAGNGGFQVAVCLLYQCTRWNSCPLPLPTVTLREGRCPPYDAPRRLNARQQVSLARTTHT